ncbi:Elongation factor Ts [Candidatus Fokinia solitaria]|uniref:Elongation factor Ts n=1 Tax=Candidatus Fokinia solitaria TaxID=1802984 RepID=A0A2U8BRM6_9RICK|nr:translation elongation factor Ts [Candidatus Fokinia solitaria]AWD32992.1 Elongation factor Ts [Candidatus Fokinia solitaria]
MNINDLIKTLRGMTQAPISECQKALKECNGDLNKAAEFLKKSGAAILSKNADRATKEGVVCLSMSEDRKKAVVARIQCETDFVARSEAFLKGASQIANIVLNNAPSDDIDTILGYTYNGVGVRNILEELAASLRENIVVSKVTFIANSSGKLYKYIHGNMGSDCGTICSIVAIDSDVKSEAIETLGKNIAMHIAAASPVSVDIQSIPTDFIEKEKATAEEEAKKAGKPESIIQKIVAGRMQKVYEESVLLEQKFIVDNSKKISEVLSDIKGNVKVAKFVRMQLKE